MLDSALNTTNLHTLSADRDLKVLPAEEAEGSNVTMLHEITRLIETGIFGILTEFS